MSLIGDAFIFSNPTGMVTFYEDSVQTINLMLINDDTLKVVE